MSEQRVLYKLNPSQRDIAMSEIWLPKQTVESSMSIIGSGYFAEENFDPDAMQRAYWALVRLNESLRLRIVRKGGRLMQYVQQETEPQPLPIRRLTGGKKAFLDYCKNPERPKISIFDPQLCCAELIDCADGTGGIVLWQHHICSDGYSMDTILYEQLCQYYDAYRAGQTPPEPKRIFRYTDVLEADKKRKKKKVMQDFFWWLKQHLRYACRLCIPVKTPRVDVAHDSIEAKLEGELYEKVQDLCAQTHCSFSNVITTAVSIMTAQLSGKDCFMLTTLSHGRMNFAQKKTTGAMQTNVPLFFDFRQERTVGELLKKTYMDMLSALSHTKFSYMTHCYVFDFLFNLLHMAFVKEHYWMEISQLERYIGSGQHSLQLHGIDLACVYDILYIEIRETPGQYADLKWMYAKKTLSPETARKLKGQFFGVLEQMCDPERSVRACLNTHNK